MKGKMTNNRVVTSFMKTFFDESLSIRGRTFYLIAITGISAELISATLVAIIAHVSNESIVPAIIDLMFAATAFGILIFARKTEKYKLCGWIAVIGYFIIAFPVRFFFHGGYRGGGIIAFLMALYFTTLLLEKRARKVILVTQFFVYAICIAVSFYFPDLVVGRYNDFRNFLDTVMSFVVFGSVLIVASLLRYKMIMDQQRRIEEQRKELEARNETLAQYDQMKSEFLAQVAHELNTPLAVIAASSEDTMDILSDLGGGNGDGENDITRHNHIMEEIIENQMVITNRVKLINSVLLELMDTVAIESGRLPLEREHVSMKEFLETIGKSQFGKIDANNNQIKYDLPKDLPAVMIDKRWMEQVIVNLLSNATKHTVNGAITLKLEQKERWQVVSVIDTGVGMSGDMAKEAVKQYVSSKPDYWRHGIGLHIVRKIVVAHGGIMEIRSEKGKGTTVSFTVK